MRMDVRVVDCLGDVSDEGTLREYFGMGADLAGFRKISGTRISRMRRVLTRAIGKHDQGITHWQHPPEAVQHWNVSTV
jgi:hypothetical protein